MADLVAENSPEAKLEVSIKGTSDSRAQARWLTAAVRHVCRRGQLRFDNAHLRDVADAAKALKTEELNKQLDDTVTNQRLRGWRWKTRSVRACRRVKLAAQFETLAKKYKA